MSAFTAAMMRRLLACVLVAAVSANAGAKNQTKREVAGPFLSDVIRRIDDDRRQVARPVQDLQVALDRIAEIFGPEAPNMEEAPIFELPENAEVEALSPMSTSLSSAVLPTAPTPASRPLSVNGISDALSPQELQALYKIAAQKGLNLDLSAIKEGVFPAPASSQGSKAGSAGITAVSGPTPVPPSSTGSTLEPAESYYYYFVPIKNLNGPLRQQTMQTLMNQNSDPHAAGMASSAANHAADAAASAALMAGGADRAVEPLFMAMAGFVGMALMFVASVLFLPKLGALRSLKHAPDEVASIGKLVLQSIEGKDCSERLACEIGRAARTMKLGGKPLRVLELCLPPPMAVHISRIRRAVARKEKCNFIPCKFQRPTKIPLLPKKPLVKPLIKPPLFKPVLKPPLRPVRDGSPYKPSPGTPPSNFGTSQLEYPQYSEYSKYPEYPEGKWSTTPGPPLTSSRTPTSSKPPTSQGGPTSSPRPLTSPRTPMSHRTPSSPRPPTSLRPPTSQKTPLSPRPPLPPRTPASSRPPLLHRPTSPRPPTSQRPQQKKNPKVTRNREPRVRRR